MTDSLVTKCHVAVTQWTPAQSRITLYPHFMYYLVLWHNLNSELLWD